VTPPWDSSLKKFFSAYSTSFPSCCQGALVTYLLKDWLGPELLGKTLLRPRWSGRRRHLSLHAYLTGHFIFLIGSLVVDHFPVRSHRTATHAETIGRLSKCKKRPWRLNPFSSPIAHTARCRKAVRQVIRIKEKYLDPIHGSAAVNVFQWSKARLTVEHPDAMSHVKRFEADSKFFRSFVIGAASGDRLGDRK
jgi:hypothetical protein